jgi:FlgD Ig-like domain
MLLKIVLKFSAFALMCVTPLFAQETAFVTWNLIPPDSQNVSATAGFINGSAVTSKGMVAKDYTGLLTDGGGPLGSYQRWYLNANWPDENTQNSNRFIKFSVKPNSGYKFQATSIEFYINAGGTGNIETNFYYSTDSSFSSSTKLNTSGNVAVSRDSAIETKYFIQSIVDSGEVFYFRIYPWLPGGSTNTGKYIYLQKVEISGLTVAAGNNFTATLPIVYTSHVNNISQFAASCGGNVTSDGGSLVNAKGICWDTAASPTINDNKTVDGRGTGSFTGSLTNLQSSTKYYVRAYATNSVGTAYGNEISFQTEDTTGLTPAFPGAEGFGRYTTGGRGGRVLRVTNLNDSGPGSLRDAVDQDFPRIVVFEVSGTIVLKSYLKISHGDLTIAGQTAPGDGICIRDYTVEVEADNIIVRYLRFRLGDLTKLADDDFSGRDHERIIIDHCSMSWAIDENSSWYDNKFFTMQWCIISESLYHSYHPKGNHGYGGIWGGMGATFHHNLLADNSSRNPRFNGARYNSTHQTEIADFRNNVIFNWGFNSAYGGESGNYNMVNNYYKPGPATSSSKKSRIVNPSDPLNPNQGYSKWYIDGNYVEGDPAVTADNWNGGVQPDVAPLDSIRLYSPVPVAHVYTQSALQAYDSVLADAGDNFPVRDSVDTRVMQEVKTGDAPYGASYNGGLKGIIDSQTDVGGWPTLNSTAPPIDSDHDGMPDSWENSHGLNPNDSTDESVVGTDGYTMIEDYINSLVPDDATGIRSDKQLPRKYKLEQNYPNPFNPSTVLKYDLSKAGMVHLNIYNILGELVSKVVNEFKPAGTHSVIWRAKDSNGNELPSGVYIARLVVSNFSQSVKLLLIK